MVRRAPRVTSAIAAALVLAACASDGAGTAATTSVAPAAPITGVSTSTTPTTVPATTVAATGPEKATTVPTTEAATEAPTTSTTEVPGQTEIRDIGLSVEGRVLHAIRRGTPGGRVVLVIGVIHGDEPAGAQIVDELERLPVPDGVDLWLLPSMNPDGQAKNERHNADGVDLNRNFPYDWGSIGQPGDGQYAGPSAASEPETQAVVAFVTEIHPDLVIWYHQDLNRIAPGKGRDGAIRARYAELVGLPLVSITGGTYTGVAATWARHAIEPGVAFIVELGVSITPDEARLHAASVLTLASEPN